MCPTCVRVKRLWGFFGCGVGDTYINRRHKFRSSSVGVFKRFSLRITLYTYIWGFTLILYTKALVSRRSAKEIDNRTSTREKETLLLLNGIVVLLHGVLMHF